MERAQEDSEEGASIVRDVSLIDAKAIEEYEMQDIVARFIDNFDEGIERKREEEKRWTEENKEWVDKLLDDDEKLADALNAPDQEVANQLNELQQETEQLNSNVAQQLEAQVQEQTGQAVEVSHVVIGTEDASQVDSAVHPSEQIVQEPMVQDNAIQQQEPARPFAKPEVLERKVRLKWFCSGFRNNYQIIHHLQLRNNQRRAKVSKS